MPGVAVFLSPSRETTPLALRAEVEYTNTFHERVLLVSVDQVSVPQVEDDERFTVEKLGGRFTIWHVSIRVGYQEKMNVPAALRLCRKQGALERNLDLEHAKYFLSRITIAPTDAPPLTLLAQAALHRDGPQRREPDRGVPAATGEHRDHRIAGRALIGDGARRTLVSCHAAGSRPPAR